MIKCNFCTITYDYYTFGSIRFILSSVLMNESCYKSIPIYNVHPHTCSFFRYSKLHELVWSLWYHEQLGRSPEEWYDTHSVQSFLEHKWYDEYIVVDCWLTVDVLLASLWNDDDMPLSVFVLRFRIGSFLGRITGSSQHHDEKFDSLRIVQD